MELAATEISFDEKLQVYGDRQADLTILSWGSNKGAIIEALDLLEEADVAARLIQARLMLPFPADEFSELLADAAPLVIVESNFSGQFAQLLRQHTGIKPDHMILKYNGRPISADEIVVAINEIRTGEAPARIVLRNPLQ